MSLQDNCPYHLAPRGDKPETRKVRARHADGGATICKYWSYQGEVPFGTLRAAAYRCTRASPCR
jgi:hypothetical protein